MNETDTHMKIWKKNILIRESSDYKHWHELERAKVGSEVGNEFQWERNWPCNREEFEFYVIWNGNWRVWPSERQDLIYVFKRSHWLLWSHMSLKDHIGCIRIDAERLVRKPIQHFRGKPSCLRQGRWRGIEEYLHSICISLYRYLEGFVSKCGKRSRWNTRYLAWAIKVWEEQCFGENMEEILRIHFWIY